MHATHCSASPIRIAAACAILAILAITACDTDPRDTVETDGPPPPRVRTEVFQDTIIIEGNPEPSRSRLVQSPAGAPVPFSTYVPEGIQASVEGDGDTTAVRFAAAFDGRASREAWMHVRFYPPGTTVEEARQLLSAFLVSRRPEDAPMDGQLREEPYDVVEPPAWAEEAYVLRYRGDGNALFTGRGILAVRDDRVFHVLYHYPVEFGDGLAPRFARILELWRWDRTGELLGDQTPVVRSGPS
jgi:hypothetical protein